MIIFPSPNYLVFFLPTACSLQLGLASAACSLRWDSASWRNRPLQGGCYPYVYVDGIYLRRNWGGEYENVAILVAIAVNEDGCPIKRSGQSHTARRRLKSA